MLSDYWRGWSGWDLAQLRDSMVAAWAVFIWGLYVVVASAFRLRTAVGVDGPRLILGQRLARGGMDESNSWRLGRILESKDRTLIGGAQ